MATFIPDRRGMAQAARTEDMERAMKELADEVAENARNLAPIDEGDYIAGIESISGEDDGVSTGRVNANDWKSGIIEFYGTTGPPPPAPLRKGAEQAGLKIEGKNATR